MNSIRGGQSSPVNTGMEGYSPIRLFNHLGNGGSFVLNSNKTVSVSVNAVTYNFTRTYSGYWGEEASYMGATAYSTTTRIETNPAYIPATTPWITIVIPHETAGGIIDSWDIRPSGSYTDASRGTLQYTIKMTGDLTLNINIQIWSQGCGGEA